MLSFELYITPGNWNIFTGRKNDKAFLPFIEKVWARDQYTCQFCGFQAREFLDVVNINRNYRDNRLSNLATACPFCSQCQFLEAVGFDSDSGGQVIYLPEMSQNDLNSFCHVLFCAMQNGGDYRDTAQNVYRNLRLRCQIVEKQLGVGTSNPRALGQLVLEYQATHPKMSQTFMQPLRLLPSYTKFKTQLDTWARSAAAEVAQLKKQ